MLRLEPEKCLGKGTERLIFDHPSNPALVVKVLMPQEDLILGRGFKGTSTRLFPSVRVRQIRKEYHEYARIMLGHPDPAFVPPIAHMYGFAATNLGLGCLSEKVIGTDGTTGPTLYTLTQDAKLASEMLTLLNDCVAGIYDCGLRAGDLNPRNFVFGRRSLGTGSFTEQSSCVLVDGFGDIHAIPVRSVSRWSNRKGLDQGFTRLAGKIGLAFDVITRQFS